MAEPEFRVLRQRYEIHDATPSLLASVPGLCARSPGLHTRDTVSPTWLQALLDRAIAVVIHEVGPTKMLRNGKVHRAAIDAVAILLPLPGRLHAEILCAGYGTLDTALQAKLTAVAREHGSATLLSISLDASSVALGENLGRLEQVAQIVFAHRQVLASSMSELGRRFQTGILDQTDRDILFELLRHKYPTSQPGPQSAPLDAPWPGGQISELVNEVNAARQLWAKDGADALAQMRQTLARPEVRTKLRGLAASVRKDGTRVRQFFDQDTRISLTRDEMVNALVYELRKVFRASGTGNCDAWLAACLTPGKLCPQPKADCDSVQVASAMDYILQHADEQTRPLLLERLRAMTQTFWVTERAPRTINQRYVWALLSLLKGSGGTA